MEMGKDRALQTQKGGKMKIAVVGSRNFNNYQLLKDTLDKYKEKCELIISGGAKGADKLAKICERKRI